MLPSTTPLYSIRTTVRAIKQSYSFSSPNFFIFYFICNGVTGVTAGIEPATYRSTPSPIELRILPRSTSLHLSILYSNPHNLLFQSTSFCILPLTTSLYWSILHFTPHSLRPRSASSCLLLPSVYLFYFLIPTLFYLFLPFLSSTSLFRVLFSALHFSALLSYSFSF
jgi:hypothetical protein